MRNYMRKAVKEVNRQRKLLTRQRAKLGLSLRQLSRTSGVSAPTINRFENGKEIELTNFVALFGVLWERDC